MKVTASSQVTRCLCSQVITPLSLYTSPDGVLSPLLHCGFTRGFGFLDTLEFWLRGFFVFFLFWLCFLCTFIFVYTYLSRREYWSDDPLYKILFAVSYFHSFTTQHVKYYSFVSGNYLRCKPWREISFTSNEKFMCVKAHAVRCKKTKPLCEMLSHAELFKKF